MSADDVGFSVEPRGPGEVRSDLGSFSINDELGEPKPIIISIGDMDYILNLQPGAPQIVIISREEKGEQTKVYLNEEFIEGRRRY